MADRARLDLVRSDLRDEHAALDQIVAVIDDQAWDIATPAEGWSVRDQISHLAWVDDRAVEAICEPDLFAAGLKELQANAPDDPMSIGVGQGRSMSPGGVLQWWRRARGSFLEATADVQPDTRIPWYGPPMGAVSFVTARLMETWAHGQDVVDALGASRPPSDRLRHVAHIGVSARPFSFAAHGLDPPSEPVRVELAGPSGDRWTWGPTPAADSVAGDAVDFCLVVTRRRHIGDTNLDVRGPVAIRWMSLAQAYAGPPGRGRTQGQFGGSS